MKNMKKYLKKKNQLKYYKFLVKLIIQKWIIEYKIVSEENISQEFRLKKIAEIRNYLFEEINQNELMSKKHKKFVEFRIILITYLL